MTGFILIALIGMAVLFVVKASSGTGRGAQRRSIRPARLSKPIFDRTKLPAGLGLRDSVPLTKTEARLERALLGTFGSSLRLRVSAKFPAMSEDEYECRLLELKRYFLMTALLRETPMFSDAIDDIWHEMLMFTREYQRFGESFLGETIHHAPNVEPVSTPGERAWFDWLYAHLFVPTPFSAYLWNGFCRFPMDRERLAFIESPISGRFASDGFGSAARIRMRRSGMPRTCSFSR